VNNARTELLPSSRVGDRNVYAAAQLIEDSRLTDQLSMLYAPTLSYIDFSCYQLVYNTLVRQAHTSNVVSECCYAQTPLIRFVVDLLYNISICCGLVVDFMGLGVT